MLSHQTTTEATPISRTSLTSGKSSIPYVKDGMVAYVNTFSSFGQVDKVTVITVKGTRFEIRVVRQNPGTTPETLFVFVTNKQGVLAHCYQDLSTGNHRLFSAEASSRRAKDPIMETEELGGVAGFVEFDDGISKLLAAIEVLTGVSCNSRLVPVGREVGVSSNMPTLESVVMKEAGRHAKVRRPVGSKSPLHGMETTPMGGAKSPGRKEQITRLHAGAARNLAKAEEAFSSGQARKAECFFKFACEFENRAAALKQTINDRMAMLRERAAAAREARLSAPVAINAA